MSNFISKFFNIFRSKPNDDYSSMGMHNEHSLAYSDALGDRHSFDFTSQTRDDDKSQRDLNQELQTFIDEYEKKKKKQNNLLSKFGIKRDLCKKVKSRRFIKPIEEENLETDLAMDNKQQSGWRFSFSGVISLFKRAFSSCSKSNDEPLINNRLDSHQPN